MSEYVISFVVGIPIALITLIMGIKVRSGKYSSSLSLGYTRRSYSDTEKKVISKITGNYLIVTSLFLLLMLLIIVIDRKYIVLSVFLVVIPLILLPFHLRSKLKHERNQQ